MKHLSLLSYKNCDASGIYTAMEILSIANQWYKTSYQRSEIKGELFNWDIVSLDGGQIIGDNRTKVYTTCSVKDIVVTDYIVIPGSTSPLDLIGNVPNQLIRWIREHHEKKALISACSTGVFLLAESGILDHKAATTNLAFSGHFKKLYPTINMKSDRLITDDDGIICSGSTSCILDLCLYLIKKSGFEELVLICATAILNKALSPNVSHGKANFQKKHPDSTIQRAQRYMERKFTGTITVEALASNFGICQRHFVRRFKNATGDSPKKYLQRVRIEAAKQKLVNTCLSISEISQDIGYEDPNSFGKLFKKTTGLSPGQYRIRFTNQ